MKFFSFFLLFLASLTLAVADTNPLRNVNIGVLAYNGKDQAVQRWYPTALYLSRQIPQVTFHIIPLTHAEIASAILKGQLDFILTNPGHYVRLEVEFGATRIVTFTARYRNQPLTRFSSVLFSRADQSVDTLSELAGKRLAAVSEDAFGGYQLAQQLLLENGMDAKQDMQVLWMGFPQTDIVKAVLQGRAEVGTVRSGVLEKMAQQRDIGLDQIHVIHPQQHENFPLLHSTRLFPEWPLARLPQTDEQLAKQVAMSLLRMPPDAPPALASGGAGWTIPLEYNTVHDVFRRLQVPPYQLQPMTLVKLWQSYRHWFFLFFFVFSILVFTLLFYSRINRQLKKTQLELLLHKQQLERVVEQRTAELIEANKALQEDIQSRIQFEETLHDGCETLQSLYSITLRQDLTRRQRLQSITDLGLQHFSAELVMLCKIEDQSATCCASSPNSEVEVCPVNLAKAQQSIREGQMLTHSLTANNLLYVVCPIVVSEQSRCVLEIIMPRPDPTHSVDQSELGSELSLRILNLLTQWVGHELFMLEQEDLHRVQTDKAREKLADITPRERDVLLLVADGKSNKLIARSLEISPKTVELHRSNLLRKTGASNATQLVKLAVQAGLSH